jgi:hypothetical protein
MNKIAYIVKETGIVLFKDGKTFTADKSFWSYDLIIDRIKTKDFEGIEALFSAKGVTDSISNILEKKIEVEEGDIKIENGEVFVGGRKIYGSISNRIIEMAKNKFDIKPLTNFLIKLLKNPSRTATLELYNFMEKANVTIDEDGFIIAYKKVRHDYFDIHSNTVNYAIGNIVEMSRNEVDDNRNNLCSDGLHFCSFDYLSKFSSSGSPEKDRVLIVKIDPADVVSIPSDHNDAKARTCKMEVIGEVKNDNEDVLAKTPFMKAHQTTSSNVQMPQADLNKDNILKVFYSKDKVDLAAFNKMKDAFNKIIEKVKMQGKHINVLALERQVILDSSGYSLKELTRIYNEIVLVYNSISGDFNNKVPAVSIFKCSKIEAIKKIEALSTKLTNSVA